MKTQLKAICQNFINLIYPSHCLLCMRLLTSHCLMVCQKCQTFLPWQSNCCQQCAITLPESIPVGFQEAGEAHVISSSGAYIESVSSEWQQQSQSLKSDRYIPVGFQEAGEARAKSSSGAYIKYVSSEMSTQQSQSLKSDGYNQRKCGNCLKDKPFYDISFAAWKYQPPISHFISQLKFHHKLKFAKFLGSFLAEYLQQHRSENLAWPQYLIPVPLHRKKLSKRGFNQALEIARTISKKVNVPINLGLCIRKKNTLPQSQLNAPSRIKNLNEAFKIKKVIFPKHIAIIDDVMTTGVTINSLSKVLKQGGVEKIEIWSCARASNIKLN